MASEISETINNLADRWSGAAAILPGFPLLARGAPVEIAELCEASGSSADEIERTLQHVRCERDDSGRIIGLYGMSLARTPHEVRLGTALLYSCCALWAHVIPKLVGQQATVVSRDPIAKAPVELHVSPAGVARVDPDGAWATLAIASKAEISAGVGRAFCSHARHFRSRQNAEQFARGDPRRRALPVETLNQAGVELLASIKRASDRTGA
jgi:hypothetical protein